jgi:hypothetical protein
MDLLEYGPFCWETEGLLGQGTPRSWRVRADPPSTLTYPAVALVTSVAQGDRRGCEKIHSPGVNFLTARLSGRPPAYGERPRKPVTCANWPATTLVFERPSPTLGLRSRLTNRREAQGRPVSEGADERCHPAPRRSRYCVPDGGGPGASGSAVDLSPCHLSRRHPLEGSAVRVRPIHGGNEMAGPFRCEGEWSRRHPGAEPTHLTRQGWIGLSESGLKGSFRAALRSFA